jgi:hypothetical protein
MWFGYWWVQQVVSRGHDHSLVALFFLSVSSKDHSLYGPWSSHILIIPSTYLLMRAGRLVTLLSWAPALFGQTDWWRDRWRSKHHSEAGPQVWGLGVQVWTETWDT